MWLLLVLLLACAEALVLPVTSGGRGQPSCSPRRGALWMNKVSFEYCTKCRWGLRASWLSQELLTTFQSGGELTEVSLVPISEPSGTFRVLLNGEAIWDRRSEKTPGFPEAKELKQLIRDVVSPDKDLGHSDRRPTRVLEVVGDDEVESIKTVLAQYLDGLYEGDVAKIGSAFHPTCSLTHFNTTSGALQIVSRDQWLDVVANRPSPKSLGLSRHDSIESIQVISPTTAFVKLKCAIPPRFFTDSLNLLKTDGKSWRIAQKLFAVEIK